METKLAKIDSSQLEEVVKNSGLAIQEGEEIKKSYIPFLNQLAEIQEQSTKINFEKPASIDETIARELRLKTVKIRTGAGDLKESRKRIHLLKGNLEQAAFNLISASCKLAEESFTQVEKAREIAESKRKKELAEARSLKMQPYLELIAWGSYDLENMPEEQFVKLLDGLEAQRQFQIAEQKKAEEERIAKEKEQERIRLENEKLRQEAEAKERQLQLEREKVEMERKAAEEKARKEREAIEAKAAEERRKANEKLAFERKKAEELAEKERKIAAEKLRIEQEKAAKLQAEIKARQEAELKAKKEAEDKKKEEKKAKAAPDKEKLTNAIRDLEIKDLDLKNEESRIVEKDIRLKLVSFKLWCETQIKTL